MSLAFEKRFYNLLDKTSEIVQKEHEKLSEFIEKNEDAVHEFDDEDSDFWMRSELEIVKDMLFDIAEKLETVKNKI